MRVHELAKELGTDSKSVIRILNENECIGTVKNHMSNVDDHQQGVVRLGGTLESIHHVSGDKESFDDIAEVDNVEPSLYDVVKEDVEVAPIETDEEEQEKAEEDSKLSFGQKAFAKAKSEEMTSSEKETKEQFAKLQTDVWTKKVEESDKKIEEQSVIVERPTGFWDWLKGLF